MTQRTFKIPRLKSGGLITTYRCVARCGHCLYNCGPHRAADYIEPESARDVFIRIRALGSNLRDYVIRNYWLHPGGRALAFFRHGGNGQTVDEILEGDRYGCEVALGDTSHFHVDQSGNYVPGLCSGLSVNVEDLGSPLEPSRYPLITRLMAKGIKGLYAMASSEFGFQTERDDYVNKCDLCHDIRSHLVHSGWNSSKELEPKGHYGSV